MQHRENQIHPQRLPAIGFLYHQPVVGGHGGKQAGNAGIALLPAAIGDERKLPGVEKPLPGAGDADRQELVFIAVQLPQDGGDGELGNIVLGGSAAEQNGNSQFWA